MFNKKNDPLIDSVKAVMEDSEIQRRVESLVNEHFGVVSKKALPHEMWAEYDAVLAEAKKCAMEEEGTHPKTPKEKSLAALKEPKDKITHADVLKGRKVIPEESEQIDEASPRTMRPPTPEEKEKSVKRAKRNLSALGVIKGPEGKFRYNEKGEKVKVDEEYEELDEGWAEKFEKGRVRKNMMNRAREVGRDAAESGDRKEAQKQSRKYRLLDKAARGPVLGKSMKEDTEQLDEKAKWRKNPKLYSMVTDPEGLDSISYDYHHDYPRSTGVKRAKSDLPHPEGSLMTRDPVAINKKTGKPKKSGWQGTDARKGKIKASLRDKSRPNLPEEYEQLKEKVVNPYAVGMAAAMKSTGDKPPLKKSTITKAHKIAKKIDEESVFEEIRANLEEQLAYVYENYDDESFADYIGSLTEEEIEILGLMEAISGLRSDQQGGTALQTQPKNVPGTPGSAGITPGGPNSILRPRTNAVPSTGDKGIRPGMAPGVPTGTASPSTPATKTATPATQSKTLSSVKKTPNTAATRTTPRPMNRPAAPQRKFGFDVGRRGNPGMGTAGRGMSAGSITNRALGGVYEETDAPEQIKESFEQFIRNKFLKG